LSQSVPNQISKGQTRSRERNNDNGWPQTGPIIKRPRLFSLLLLGVSEESSWRRVLRTPKASGDR